MQKNNRRFDVVIFGATGFTGKLTAAYLAASARREPGKFRWAIAGRNMQKLRDLRDQLGDGAPDIIVAESQNLSSLIRMTEQTKVVSSTVGPYT